MRKTILLLSLFIGLSGGAVLAASAPPSLLFSDLTSGPGTGGKDDQGAIVTVVGRNFGAQQSDSYVTVGGGKAAAYLFWSDTKISFQVGAAGKSGDIKVTTAGGTSNGLGFIVRGGNIYFVDDNGAGTPNGAFESPWRSIGDFLRVMKAGDIVYVRGGTYTSNVSLTSGHANGVLNNEIAFVGYPGEMPTITSSRADFDFQDNKQYFVVAGFRLYSSSKNFSVTASHIRIVNNDCESLKNHSYGMIHPTIGSDIKIYGNDFHGATSGNKLDHPVYVGYGADHVDIGWNRFYNNNIDRGPVISINTDGAQQAGYKFENIRIHDNTIDVSGARGIGIVCTQSGSSVYIYNNVFTGNSPLQSVYMYSGSLYMYNNAFYGSPGAAAIQLTTMNDGSYLYRPETVEIKNNIIWNRNGGQYFEFVNENDMKQVLVENNAYYGAGPGPARDTRAVSADPLFVDPDKGNFLLQVNSPCINSGADTRAVTPFDKDGYARLQEGAVDIGPHEYAAPYAGSPTSDTGTGGIVAVNPGDPATPSTPPPPSDPSDPSVTPLVPTPPANDILVLGSASGRGTINPDKGETAKIYFRGNETGDYHARIFTLTGEQVWEKVLENVSEGVFEWAPGNIASATYVVSVQGPGLKIARKLAIIR